MKNHQDNQNKKGGFSAQKTPSRAPSTDIIAGANEQDQLNRMRERANKNPGNEEESGTSPDNGRESRDGESE